MTPDEFLHAYEQRTNTHDFEQVKPLLDEHAVYWFSDGSFRGTEEIKQAFEKTWDFVREERYAIEQVQWLVRTEESAVCIYTFHWQGLIGGKPEQGVGRGTSVLHKVDGQWKVIHEHLSPMPACVLL